MYREERALFGSVTRGVDKVFAAVMGLQSWHIIIN